MSDTAPAVQVTATNPCAVCFAGATTPFQRERAAKAWPATTLHGRTVHLACQSRATFLLGAWTDAEVVETGAVRWTTNGHYLNADTMALAVVFGLADLASVEPTERAREAQTTAFVADYKRAQAIAGPPSGEELYELRAAFGPGAVVVDAITGRRTQL